MSNQRSGIAAISQRLSPTQRSEDGSALVSVVLFMVILAGLSFVLLSVVVGQIGPAYQAQKSTQTVYAAQGGLQAGLGSLRAATKTDLTGATVGDRTKLPCTLSGSVDGAGAESEYDVQIRYYISDPTGKPEAWLNSPANRITCTPGSGVAAQPGFAYITSSGSGDSAIGRPADEGNRALAATYTFRVTNENIPGGPIYNNALSRCLEASMPSGNIDFVSTCTGNDENQLWIYDDTYQIVLASSTITGPKLCITSHTIGSGSAESPGPGRAKLQPCKAETDPARWNQLFSWEGSHSWYVSKQDFTPSTVCLREQGGGLHTGGCTPFAPSPAVGAGAAAFETNQIVNYEEFGRCLDVTDQDINKAFMISYPCKQDPTGTGVHLNWNHKWTYEEAEDVPSRYTTISVLAGGSATQKRCLTTPTGSGKYPTFAVCNVTNARQTWQRIRDNGDYATSYVFTDNSGRCLQADKNDKYNQWSRIIVATCDGGLDQKWNAPAVAYDSTFGGFKELG